MATVPVPVKQSAPAPATPDIWRSLRTEMDRLFDNFTSRFGVAPFFQTRFDTSLSLPSPAVDITEEEGAFNVSAEVPGMSEKDINVSLSGDTLTIKGEKRQEREEKGDNRYLSERSYGAFQRSFSLPEDVDREKIAASFAKGVLTVTLPKSAKAAPKKIEVKAAG
jgi:HSP20 family protein